MFKKTMIALFAVFALIATFEAGANAQSGCDDSTNSAYSRMPRC